MACGQFPTTKSTPRSRSDHTSLSAHHAPHANEQLAIAPAPLSNTTENTPSLTRHNTRADRAHTTQNREITQPHAACRCAPNTNTLCHTTI